MSYNKTKTDPVLGKQVHDHLVKAGVETPVIDNGLSRTEKIDKIEGHFDHIMDTLGLDLSDDSLTDTPKRVAKMYVNEIFWGLDYEAFPKCTTVNNKMHYDEMVVERNINVQSNCEHHFVVIDGLATVAYIPNEKVLGLSKINRIVEYFSKRPQIQERLTEQIYYALQYILGTDNIAVLIDAQHYCVKSRGVEDVGSSTITSKLGGGFRDKSDPGLRAEFLSIARMQ
jgi:GTP cyclohydrolase IA|tara:strand:- start:379 stop:1059 length:681 start_codon:yes stop_codon:yes gene_type:complete